MLIPCSRPCPSGGMVDAADSKSVACKGVLVRVRPGAPIQTGLDLFSHYAPAEGNSMRIFLAFLLAIALGAAPAQAQVDADPVALITAIYQTYAENMPSLGGDAEPGLPHIYSQRLQALLDKDEK